MKYKCKQCEHEFDGLSFINKCEKCGSDNIFRKSQKASNTIWILLFILLIVLSLVVYNLVKEKESSSEESVSYSSVFHNIINGNEVNFVLVVASGSDTIEYNHKEHAWLALEITQGNREYYLDDNGAIFPCNKELIRYQWNNHDLMKSEKVHNYIDKNEFLEEFIISKKAVCSTEWKIVSVSDPDNKCNIIVKTDHPKNQPQEIISEEYKASLKGQGLSDEEINRLYPDTSDYYSTGDSIIKISISGKKGPYRFKNKWNILDEYIINIWALSTDFNDTLSYLYNGKRYDTACFTNFIDTIAEEDSIATTEKEETQTNNPPDGSDCKQEVTSHYSSILNDVENNWHRVYDYAGSVMLNGEPQKSFPGDVLSAVDDGKRVVVKDVLCKQGTVVTVILEIK